MQTKELVIFYNTFFYKQFLKVIETMGKKTLVAALAIACGLTACVGDSNQTNSIDNNPINPATLVQNGEISQSQLINATVPMISTTIGDQSFVCSGTLLDSQTVLTAAHCVLDMEKKNSGVLFTNKNVISAANISVMLPKNLSIPVGVASKDGINTYAVEQVFVHPEAFLGAGVDGGSLDIIDTYHLNDLAILHLKKPVARQYNFAYLATENPKPNTPEIIVGYGVNNGDGVVYASKNDDGGSGILRYATSYVSKITDGSDGRYIDVGGKVYYNDSHSEYSVYTKICQGDSGGPDFVLNNKRLVVTGVHSFGSGEGCGEATTPSSSVSVAAYYDWINGGYLDYHL